MKKISIILPNLVGGGAERLAIYLGNDWLQRGYKVEFVLMQKHGELISLLSPRIAVVDLKANRIRNTIFPLQKYLRSSLPDLIWVGMWPLTSASIIAWLLSGRNGSMYLIDHNHLSISAIKELRVSSFYLKFIMRVTYPFASGIIAVSKGVKTDLCKLGAFNKDQVKVIYNPAATGIPGSDYSTKDEKQKLWGPGFHKHILTVGSLEVQKNHERLIKAFAKLPRSLNAKLIILGEGGLRMPLESLIAQLGLQDSVALPGFAKDPYPWFLSADLFVLSSDWEGLPTVLIEALECGLPVVSTDCPSGPSEILDNGLYGQLVPLDDIISLSAAIEHSLLETHDHEALINRSKDFSIKNISKQYLEYFGFKT